MVQLFPSSICPPQHLIWLLLYTSKPGTFGKKNSSHLWGCAQWSSEQQITPAWDLSEH